MANSRFTGRSESYIFENAGGMRDQLEQTVLQELQNTKYPLKASVTVIKSSGGGLLGALGASKEQCVAIQVDDETQIVISNTTVGTYLYVEVYLMIQEKISLFSGIKAMMDNAFKQQKRNAYYAAACNAAQAAFHRLNLKQQNYGYEPSKNTITNDN